MRTTRHSNEDVINPFVRYRLWCWLGIAVTIMAPLASVCARQWLPAVPAAGIEAAASERGSENVSTLSRTSKR